MDDVDTTPRDDATKPEAEAQRLDRERSHERERRTDPRARVLVVEDEHELRQLVADWLRSKGYDAIEAADARDAIELVGAGLRPDAIVLDLALPGMSGHEFLEWLRERPDVGATPVVVASGEYEELRTAAAEGALAKPYEPERLARELERLLA